jgi:hypothetical protein
VECIVGWPAVSQDADWIRLQASYWCLTAEIVIAAQDEAHSFLTCMHYYQPQAAQWR